MYSDVSQWATMVILQTFVDISSELNVTGAVGSSFLMYGRDKSNGSQKTLKLLYSGGLGPNTLYLHSEPRTPVILLGIKKISNSDLWIFSMYSVRTIKKIECFSLFGGTDWDPYLGDWDQYSSFGNSNQKSPFWYISV